MHNNTFIATVSHEFRTPLASLRASLEILSTELDSLSKSEIREIINSFELSITGLQLLVDNLLNSASIEARKFTISRQQIGLDRLLMDTISLMQPILNRLSQKLVVQMSLPMAVINVDPYLIQQVLLNLLMNASKYSPESTPIELTATVSESTLIIEIGDHGIGLPEGDGTALFALFERYDAQQRNARDGLGLGLWVARTIVEAHGGTIGAKLREDGGAIFWFQLPLGEA